MNRAPWEQDDTIERVVKLTPASSITVRPVRWLWALRLALGTLGLLAGPEGIGKSILAYTLAALITRGRLDGEYFGAPRAVIVAATEDSWAHTIVPRLMAAGANLDLVYRVDVETTTDHLGASLSLPQDLVGLEDAARDVGAALLLMDPLLSRLDTALDSHKDAEVRIALEPVVSLSERAGMSTLGLIHVNKSGSQDPLNTLMGSRAFSAVARAVLYVMADPDDETLRLLGQPKNNLGQTDLPTLGFRIEPAMVANTPEGEVWTGQLEWTGESTRSIRDALEAAAATAGDRTATSEAADWLHDYLTDEGGTAASSAIKATGNKAGHSVDALKRARKRLNIISDSRGFPRQTYWLLPPQSVHQSVQPGETSRSALTAPTERQSVQLARSERSGELSRTAPTRTDGQPFKFDGRPVFADRHSGGHDLAVSNEAGDSILFLLIDSDLVEPSVSLEGFSERRLAGDPTKPRGNQHRSSCSRAIDFGEYGNCRHLDSNARGLSTYFATLPTGSLRFARKFAA